MKNEALLFESIVDIHFQSAHKTLFQSTVDIHFQKKHKKTAKARRSYKINYQICVPIDYILEPAFSNIIR